MVKLRPYSEMLRLIMTSGLSVRQMGQMIQALQNLQKEHRMDVWKKARELVDELLNEGGKSR